MTDQVPATPALAIDTLCIDTIRTLSMDAVEKANSGHPGTPMALAPVAYTIWQQFLRYDPADPAWPNRDRFVLSNGHASMLLYSLLFLAGVKDSVTLEDIKRFRQLDSLTPGHPEYGLVKGVETTTGPLGQGCGNSVGMAIAARWLAERYNRPDFPIFGYDIFVMCGDGDMMEGISSEAASIAGHLMLGNLVWIYDNNKVTIEGHTEIAFSEDVAARFKAYGWNVHEVGDANDCERLAEKIKEFQADHMVPNLIVVNSIIGYGAPHKQNTAAAHGEALGGEEIKLAKRFYGWPEEAQFLVPEGVQAHFAEGIGARGAKLRAEWLDMFSRYKTQYPDLAAELETMWKRELPEGWDKDFPTFPADPKGMATRESSGKVINALAKHYPWLVGGAADLSPSTKTDLKFESAGSFEPDNHKGRNLHFGIREHAMGAALNGMAVTYLRPYGSSFLIFSDYMKNAIRLSALMEVPVITIFTHDSIGLGEDGPTHQSIEQLIGLRAIPGLIVLRPADANEVVEAWRVIAVQKQHPTLLVLSRQAMPTLDREKYASAKGVARGAYVLADPEEGEPKLILMGTGSELSLCVAAHEKLAGEGIPTRVVSMPSWELFEQQDAAYRNEVLPPHIIARVSVEAASVIGWDRYVGPAGTKIGMRSFGGSAPAKDLMKKFGFTVENVVAEARRQLEEPKDALEQKEARDTRGGPPT